MRLGETGSKREVYTRCNQCGDSSNPNHAHKAVYPDGKTYCFKCGESTSLSTGALLKVFSGDISIDEAIENDEEWRELERSGNVQTPRFTHLEVYETTDLEDHYSFPMCTVNGDIVGWHNRHKDRKTFFNEGQKGFGFSGSTLTSSPDRPLVIVEGPYDCIEEHFVCVFGTLNKSSLRSLRLQYLWLWPDPDCLDTSEKRVKFRDMCKELNDDHLLFILGYVISDEDPDKAIKKEYVKL